MRQEEDQLAPDAPIHRARQNRPAWAPLGVGAWQWGDRYWRFSDEYRVPDVEVAYRASRAAAEEIGVS